MNDARQEQTYRLLYPTLCIFACLYALLAVGHVFLLPDALRPVMLLLAGGASGYGIVLLLCYEQVWLRRHADWVMFSLFLVGGANSFAHLFLSGDLKQSTNLVFLLGVAGFLIHDRRMFLLTFLLVLAGYVGFVGVTGNSADTVHYSVMMLQAALLSVLLHVVRNRLDATRELASRDNELIAQLLANVPAGVIARTEDGNILFANEKAEVMSGFSESELRGMSPGDPRWVLLNEQGAVIPVAELPMVAALRENRAILNRVVGMRRLNDEQLIWVLLNVFIVSLTGQGRVAVSTFIDITAQRDSERRLRESEEISRATVNSIEEGVVVVDQAGTIIRFNPATAILTGVEQADAMGQPLDQVLRLDASEEHGADAMLVRRDGASIPVAVRHSELLDDAGEARGQVIALQDVSERLKREAEQRTVDKMSSVAVLAGGIAHDFNNLLLGLYGNISLVQELNQDEAIARHLEDAMGSLDRATNLTRQLLTFATGSEPVRRQLDLEKLVREVGAFTLSGSSVSINHDFAPGLRAVEADESLLHQALSNLFINAKQAMDGEGRIDVVARNAGDDEVEVCITDTGPGIPDDLVSEIFSPYFTTKDEGIGLGLATTHSIISKHGGTIAVDAAVGSGARFTLRLPASQTTPSHASVPQSVDQSAPGWHILVMDDEDMVRRTIVKLLGHLGHRVEESRDGEEAATAFASARQRGDPFDLVIMDLTVVGGIGGREGARRILDIDADARIVVASGYSEGAEMSNHREHGFCAVLQKPFSLAKLRQTLASVLNDADQTG